MGHPRSQANLALPQLHQGVHQGPSHGLGNPQRHLHGHLNVISGGLRNSLPSACLFDQMPLFLSLPLTSAPGAGPVHEGLELELCLQQRLLVMGGCSPAEVHLWIQNKYFCSHLD